MVWYIDSTNALLVEISMGNKQTRANDVCSIASVRTKVECYVICDFFLKRNVPNETY